MTYAICGEIEFPAVRGRERILIRRFSSVKIESSWQNLTGTAEIVLPRKVRDFEGKQIKDLFASGDPVMIRLGYDDSINLEFEGYVLKTSNGAPLVITCEDEMYNLKRKTISISKSSCSLKEFLKIIAPGYNIECDDSPIGSIRYSEQSVSVILDDLKSKIGIHTYFRGKNLISGRTVKNTGNQLKIIIERQAVDNLKERNVEDVWVKVESLQKKGKTIKFETGEKKGNVITLKQPYLTKIEVERIGKDAYRKAKEPGLDGEITLFGDLRVEHGDTIVLKSIMYPEKDGSYYVDAVTKTIQENQGYRQNVKLGSKAK
ncbi:MAG: hypothetical protein ACK5MH_06790 [Bacteroidales bacterium]